MSRYIKAAIPVILLLFLFSCNRERDLHKSMGIGENRITEFTLVFFVTSDCPLCKIYRHKIAGLGHKLGSKWTVLTIRQDTAAADWLGQYGQEKGDNKGAIAKAFGATVTPEVFVLNNEGEILYSGAIDNYAYDTGKHRPVATEFYLDSVITMLNSGKHFQPFHTNPVGCFIER